MQLVINRWGNSQGIRLPKLFMELLNMKIGSELKAEIRDGKIILAPVMGPEKLSIHDLVQEMPADYEPSESESGEPQGKEIW